MKPLYLGGLGLLLVWLLAGGAYYYAQHSKMTADKVRTYLRSVDLSKLTGEPRAKALRELARRLNTLPYEERRQARLDREWSRWFTAMTDPEKADFIDATLPTGFRQMMASFEELPVDRRRRTVDDALKRLREARDQIGAEGFPEASGDTNAMPVVSEEVRQQMITTGLKTFYSDSSAQMKAEVAPVLEELQKMMESGAVFRDRRRPQ